MLRDILLVGALVVAIPINPLQFGTTTGLRESRDHGLQSPNNYKMNESDT